MRELTLTVVGIDFANADKSKSSRRMELLLCPPGEDVHLLLEPKNLHDPLAISVWSARRVQIGYLTAERAGWIGARIRAGEEHRAVFQALHGAVAYVRLRFGGGAPTLPPSPQLRSSPTAAPPDADGFYPDDDSPEWGA